MRDGVVVNDQPRSCKVPSIPDHDARQSAQTPASPGNADAVGVSSAAPGTSPLLSWQDVYKRVRAVVSLCLSSRSSGVTNGVLAVGVVMHHSRLC